jgi:methyl-accepting chemotaxis protein
MEKVPCRRTSPIFDPGLPDAENRAIAMRISVKVKLGAAFGAVLLLSAATGGVAYSNLQALNGQVGRVANELASRLDLLHEIKVHLLFNIRAEKYAISASTDKDIKQWSDAVNQEHAAILNIERELRGISSPGGDTLLDNFDKAFDEFHAIQKRTMEFSSLNSALRGQEIIDTKAAPAASDMLQSLAGVAKEIESEEPTPERLHLAGDLGRFSASLQNLAWHTKQLLASKTPADSDAASQQNIELEAALRRDRDSLQVRLDKIGAGALFTAFRADFDRWISINDKVVATAVANGSGRAMELSEGAGLRAATAAMGHLDQYINIQRDRLKTAVVQAGDAFATSRWTLIAAIVASMLVAAAAGSWIALSIGRGLARAVGLANAVAVGDLDGNIEAKGDDEVKDLIDALNRMTGNLNATAKVADAIAGGDLSVEVQRLSAKDKLGQALGRMLDSLRTAVKQRDEREAEKAQEAQQDEFAFGALGEGLGRLATGDLEHRIVTPFAAKTEKLRIDFNSAVQRLKETMVSVGANTQAIRSGTGEIASTADDLSRRSEQQAASLEETAASLDEITATVRRTAEGAQHARQVVSNAKDDAEKSGEIVRQAIEAMSGIEKSSKQISRIIGVIDEIAFQTNLLALNAGVEAARAGEAGRGFAVVAAEVRALAQRSADAAKEIKGLIQASATRVDEGVGLVAQAGDALARIAAQVSEINEEVANIAANAEEQSLGLGQVNTALYQMDQVTQQNAAMVEETTVAAQTLSRETEELAQLIGTFQIGQAAAKRTQKPGEKRRALLL